MSPVKGPAYARLIPPAGQLSGSARVICDLHLKGSGDPIQERFLSWLGRLPTGETLWILGDLFEYWVGSSSLRDPGNKPVLEALERFVGFGGFIGLIPGNRDFLIGADFEAQTGVCVFPDGAILQGPEGPWLLVHGDEFCTLDLGYQRLKKVLRSGAFRFWVRHQPAFLSRAMARRLRRASASSVPTKDPERMAMQPEDVGAAALAAGARVVLCGHAHRFLDRELAVPGSQGAGIRFLVLDAFGGGPQDVLKFASGRAPEVVSTDN